MKTIHDIAPFWANKIEQDNYSTETVQKDGLPYKLDIHIPAFCVLGEAHGFSYNYAISYDKTKISCETCAHFSGHFLCLAWLKQKEAYDPVGLFEKYDSTEYKVLKDRVVKDFEQHWNEKHG